MADPAAAPTPQPAPGTPARQEILARIRTALGTSGTGGGPAAVPPWPGPPPPRAHPATGARELADLLAERLTDYGCTVHRTAPGGVAATIVTALARRGARRAVVPPGLALPGGLSLPGPPGSLSLPEGTSISTDDGRPAAALDAFDAVITTAAVAIAETGTIVLDGSGGQGRRALSLIPDYHLCILQTGRIVAGVPDAMARLSADRPLTWISGPSATSDIELDRVEGVHGPRTLEVILVEPGGPHSGPA